MEFLDQIIAAIHETEKHGLLHDRRADGLTGISGMKTVGVIERLCRLFETDPTACYLEIGVFQGLTLVSAALAASGLPCLGIDNFATLDPMGENKSIVESRVKNFAVGNATLIDADFEVALARLGEYLGGRKVAVYFVDGPHDYRSQLVCLLAALRYLHDDAVIIVDDANYACVRQSSADFLVGHPEFKMLFDAYSPAHPANMQASDKPHWEKGWLNGVNILVRDPDGCLPDMMPPTDSDRTRYLNEWLVHRLRQAELAPEAVALADAIIRGDGAAEAEGREALIKSHAKWGKITDTRHADRNTYSDGLSEGRFNQRAR